MIEILYFARLREQLGTGRESMAPPTGVATLGDLVAHLRTRGGAWRDALGEDQTLMLALNQEMARLETPVRDGDEIALFPPVTGG